MAGLADTDDTFAAGIGAGADVATTTLQLRVRALSREEVWASAAVGPDDAVAVALADRLRAALGDPTPGRRRPGALVVVRAASVELLTLRVEPGSSAPRVDVHQLLAALAASETLAGPAEAVGLVGVFRRRRVRWTAQGPAPELGNPVALVFLEWPDGRWTRWEAPMDASGRALQGGAAWTGARHGDPLPDGLGRWWTRMRRWRPTVALSGAPPPPSGVVH
jgi:hypothetical protein